MNVNSPTIALEKLSRNIRFERARLNISQRKLADLLGLKGSSTVTHWEVGNNYPTLEMFIKLCGFFGRSANEMLETELSGLPPPKRNGTPQYEEVEAELDVGAQVSPPPDGSDDVKAMKKQVLEMLLKLENM